MTGTNPNSEIKQDDAGLSVPLDDVQIELEGGEGAPPEDQQPDGEKPAAADTGDGAPKKKRPRVDFHKRIGQLSAGLGNAERERDTFKSELEQRRLEARENGGLALHYARKSFQSDLRLAERDLAKADADGDSEAKAALTSKMATLAAEIAKIPETTDPSAGQPAPQPRAVQAPQAQPQPRASGPVQLPPAVAGTPRASWETSNPWFVPGSEDFDPDLYEEAQVYATSLEKRLRNAGRGGEVGSPAYFKQISDYMDREVFEQEPEAQPAPAPAPRANTRFPPMTNSRSPVAAPSRGPQVQSKDTVVRLTTEEQDMAQRFFGNKRHPDGRPFSKMDANKQYAWHQKNPDASMVPITMKTSRG